MFFLISLFLLLSYVHYGFTAGCKFEPNSFSFCSMPNKGKYNSVFCEDLDCPLLHYCPGDGNKYPCEISNVDCCCSDSGQTCLEQAQQLLKSTNVSFTSRRLQQMFPNISEIVQTLTNTTQKVIDSINWTDVYDQMNQNTNVMISFQNRSDDPIDSVGNDAVTEVPTSSPTLIPKEQTIIEERTSRQSKSPTSLPTNLRSGIEEDISINETLVPREETLNERIERRNMTVRAKITEPPTSLPTASLMEDNNSSADEDEDEDEVEDSGR